MIFSPESIPIENEYSASGLTMTVSSSVGVKVFGVIVPSWRDKAVTHGKPATNLLNSDLIKLLIKPWAVHIANNWDMNDC